eukprot:m.20429 g.20429  ORF g.20429 m.20429 type:complete len:68 (-) comp12143_c0_seq1:213-416(-)
MDRMEQLRQQSHGVVHTARGRATVLLVDKCHYSCAVDPQMQMTAETFAPWTLGPMECTPGTATATCC